VRFENKAKFKEFIMAKKKSSSRKRGRSAVTGKFITVKKAKRKKRTSVVETVKKRCKRK